MKNYERLGLGSFRMTGGEMKWDQRFLGLARHVSEWSRDPSTTVGAVIADRKHRIVSIGYNGLPADVNDLVGRYEHRETKLKLMIHAEANALMFATRDITGCTCYVHPMPPCSQCGVKLIQSGIKRIVSIRPSEEHIERWGEDFELMEDLYREAKVTLTLHSPEIMK